MVKPRPTWFTRNPGTSVRRTGSRVMRRPIVISLGHQLSVRSPSITSTSRIAERVEEMKSPEALRGLELRAMVVTDSDDCSSREYSRLRRFFELGEELTLRIEIFDDRLDDMWTA